MKTIKNIKKSNYDKGKTFLSIYNKLEGKKGELTLLQK